MTTDPRRIAYAINPRPFACPADPADPLGPSKLKQAEEERQEAIRRAESVLVELQAENARLRESIKIALGYLDASLFTNAEHHQAKCFLRKALNTGGPDG